ncbi:Bromodomain adjacent to zinc finger domain protein 1A [Nymphon striatum]|nr:Bromodomain adjacent to zinc finger domain protein 1A [Nymphon striatum]
MAAYRIPPKLFRGEDIESKKQKMAESLIKKLEKKAIDANKDIAEKEKLCSSENVSSSSSPQMKRSALERWSESLMSCTNISQLCLHISTLERSVEWSRSILNAKCKICRRKGDGEKMLLCDVCDRGHHLYCLKPPLTVVPKGNWVCPACRPKQTPRLKKSGSRKKIKEESDEEFENLNVSIETENFQNGIEEVTAIRECILALLANAHFSKVEPEEIRLCSICEKEGKLKQCISCQSHFHFECVSPKIDKVPRGKWKCSSCAPHKYEKEEIKSRNTDVNTPISASNSSKRGSRSRTTPKFFDDVEESPSDDLRPARRVSSGRRSTDGSLALDYKACHDLLSELTKHEDGWLFLRPVSRKDAPDYHGIIKNPMDFGTMKGKLNNVQYKDNCEFIADTNLVFNNCEAYNPDHSEEFKTGKRLKKFFELRIKQLGLINKRQIHNVATKEEPIPKKRR